MPHNIVLGSSLVLTRRVNRQERKAVDEAVRFFTLETSITLLLTVLVNVAIVATFAPISHSCNVGMKTAGECLEASLNMRGARYLWAIGLFAAVCKGVWPE
jgi:natural resistance-associated macrophage protein